MIPLGLMASSASSHMGLVATSFVQGAGQRLSGTTLTLPSAPTPGNLLIVVSTYVGVLNAGTYSHGITTDHSWSHQGWALQMASGVVQPGASAIIETFGVSASDGRNSFAVMEFSGVEKHITGETTWFNLAGDGLVHTLTVDEPSVGIYTGYLNSQNTAGATSDTLTWVYNSKASYSFTGYVMIPEAGTTTATQTFRTGREDRHSFVGYRATAL